MERILLNSPGKSGSTQIPTTPPAHSRPSFLSMGREQVRAYAKIIGDGWEYYMTKPKIILGRGGKNCECDVVVSSETAVSRQHFTIRFAPELQAFEVENLSKNGILVNGEFLTPNAPPILLTSQADISFGRSDAMRLMFILPTGNNSSMKKREIAADKNVPLLQWTGEALVEKGLLTARGICEHIEKMHPQKLKALGSSQVIDSAIRHILTQNDHIFCVADSTELENNMDPAVIAIGGKVVDAFFTLKKDQKSRFYSVFYSHKENQQRVSKKPEQQEKANNDVNHTKPNDEVMLDVNRS